MSHGILPVLCGSVEHAMGTVKTLVGSEEQLGALVGFSWDIPWDSPSPPGEHRTEGPEEQLGALVGFSWDIPCDP